MADRIPSDHDAVETIRATVERVGRTDRRKVTLPADAADAVPADEVVRLVLDGSTFHARVESDFDGLPEFRGAYETPTLARSPDPDRNRLADWLATADVPDGGSVLLDVVTADFLYGLRLPGERAVYEATDAPASGLADIARNLEDR